MRVGDVAPDFTLPWTTGKSVTLSEYHGKENVVLAFYPAAFTGGCTEEMTSYGAHLTKFDGMDTQVFGISTDNMPSQRVFAEQTGGIPEVGPEVGTRQLPLGRDAGTTTIGPRRGSTSTGVRPVEA